MDHLIKGVSARLPHCKSVLFPFAISEVLGKCVNIPFPVKHSPTGAPTDDSWPSITAMVAMDLLNG